jgi:hypothetical protein
MENSEKAQGNIKQAGLPEQFDSDCTRALELRNLIKQEMETLDQHTKAKVQSSGGAVQHPKVDAQSSSIAIQPSEADAQSSGIAVHLSNVAAELSKVGISFPYAAAQLSNPAFQTTLPFPFVGSAIPERFKTSTENGHDKWLYTGRERFAELLERFQEMQRRSDLTAFWVYGTQGYGKSHLLAALVCCLSAAEKRVVYIPDCRECLKSPIDYIQDAMLFAWANDSDMQRKVIKLDTREKISDFFKGLPKKSITFVIDEMNALAVSSEDDVNAANKKGTLNDWLECCRSKHRAVLGCSANDQTYLKHSRQKGTEKTIHTYGGLTPVSLDNVAGADILTDLDGNEAVVGEE